MPRQWVAPANHVAISLQRIPVNSLLDTGATVSLVNRNFLTKHGLKLANMEQTHNFQTANGDWFATFGPVELDVKVGGLTVPFLFYIADALPYTCLLGMDFLSHTSAKLDLPARILSLYDGLVSVVMATAEALSPVALVANVTVPPLSEAILPVRIQGQPAKGPMLIEPNYSGARSGLWVAGVVVDGGKRVVPCRVLNPTEKPIRLKEKTSIGVWAEASIPKVGVVVSATPTMQPPEPTDEEKDAVLKEKGVSLDKTAFEGEHKRQLRDLLYEYSSLFATSFKDLPGSHVLQVKIDTGSHPPVNKRNFRFNPEEKKIIGKQMFQFLIIYI